MGQNDFIIFQMMATMTSNSNDMDPTMGVWHVLGVMQATLTLLKALTKFTLEEFDKLASQIVPSIETHAKSIDELYIYIYFSFKV